MTNKEKDSISALRKSGMGYVKIAQMLSLPIGTVKSYCTRNNLTAKSDQPCCVECGKSIERLQGRREKKFCSDACRMKWWNHHTGLMKDNAVCKHCGKSFHGRAGRKYCSHACYIAERFGDAHAS